MGQGKGRTWEGQGGGEEEEEEEEAVGEALWRSCMALWRMASTRQALEPTWKEVGQPGGCQALRRLMMAALENVPICKEVEKKEDGARRGRRTGGGDNGERNSKGRENDKRTC